MDTQRFIRDDQARVPFAVIGVFLILISTFISIYLTRMDLEAATASVETLDVSDADYALAFTEADLTNSLNSAGMRALKIAGNTPVMVPAEGSPYLFDGGGVLGSTCGGTSPLDSFVELLQVFIIWYGGEKPSSDECVNISVFNERWIRNMTRHYLNKVIQSNYANDSFVYRGYVVNVQPVDGWSKVELEEVKMQLTRTVNPPVSPPGYQEGYAAYYKATVPLQISIRKLGDAQPIYSDEVHISTLINSRYPLLRDLTQEYETRINGVNAVMTETTAMSMMLTWVRGYMQYYKGSPGNIVRNADLEMVVNTALLLDQGFVFNSVDPYASVELFNNALGRTLSKDVSSEPVTLSLNLLDMACNTTGNPSVAREYYNRGKSASWINTTNISKLILREYAMENISRIADDVYTCEIVIDISRDLGEPTEGKCPSGYYHKSWGGWNPLNPQFYDTVPKADSGTLAPGTLGGGKYKLDWWRSHTCEECHKESYKCNCRSHCSGDPPSCTTSCDTCQKTVCTRTSGSDQHRIDDVIVTFKANWNSQYDVELSSPYSTSSRTTKNDVATAFYPKDVQYSGQIFNDDNLEDAYYKFYYNYYYPNGDSIIKYCPGSGCPSDSLSATITGIYDFKLKDAANNALWKIHNEIENQIHLNPNINITRYPVPSDLLRAAATDIIAKIEKNETTYHSFQTYQESDGRYSTASAKTIALAREWYVDTLKSEIDSRFNEGAELVEGSLGDQIDDKSKGIGIEGGAQAIMDTINAARGFLSGKLHIPVGLTMTAAHADKSGRVHPVGSIEAWNESVGLDVNQTPDYLSIDHETEHNGKKLYTLGIRSINPLGPTGIPILPSTPVTIVNMWTIEVQGEYIQYEVQDVDNQAYFNATTGVYEPQTYVREDASVIDPVTGETLGSNKPLKFAFITGTIIAVPPGGLGVGDKSDGFEESERFTQISKESDWWNPLSW